MVADFFTKPLQGSPFLKFRNLIMNHDPVANSLVDYRSVLRSKKTCATNERRTDGEEELTGGPQENVWKRKAAERLPKGKLGKLQTNRSNRLILIVKSGLQTIKPLV